MKQTGIIYKAENLITKKVYIGQTISPLKERIRMHYKFARTKNKNYRFSNALLKYKQDDWVWSVIESCIPIAELNSKEIYYISKYNSFKSGYNSTPGGYERFERKPSIEVECNVRRLLNTKTNEIVEANCYDFLRRYCDGEPHISNVYLFFKGRYMQYKGWIFLENKLKFETHRNQGNAKTAEIRTDKTIFRFINKREQLEFVGLRKDFIKQYNLCRGNTSMLVNNKLPSYRGWVVASRESVSNP